MIYRKTVLLILSILFFSNAGVMGNNNEPFVTHNQWSGLSKSYDYSEHYKSPKESKKSKPHAPPALSFLSKLSWVVYVLVAIIVILLVTLIVMLIVGLLKQSGEKLSKTSIYKASTYIDIDSADLENDLQKALSYRLFKEAVRIQYLILIRTLNRQKLVIWKIDKTNGGYLREMYGKKGFDVFRRLTLYFEQVWYGDREITEKDYLNLIPVFDKINLIITTSEQ
jgi:hypothetical protein